MTRAVEVSADGTRRASDRTWVPEAPIALEYNGLSYAVMMATPRDLDDFAVGFAIGEGLAASAADIADLAVAEVEQGWIVRTTVTGLGIEALGERVRTRVAESSCGLCGIENLAALAAPLPPVAKHRAIPASAIFSALGQLRALQPLGRATGAAHAAAWADAHGAIGLLREDVGRHTALDKLVGAAARMADGPGLPLTPGFILSTARCSYEIVEKAVRAGATTLVTLSLPTSLAVERAAAAGLSLWALARADSVLLVNDASA